MTKRELALYKHAIKSREDSLNTIIDTFGYDSPEVFFVKNELSLLKSLFGDNPTNKKPRKIRKDKGMHRKNRTNYANVMYINKDGDLFIQLSKGGGYTRTHDDMIIVKMFQYCAVGRLVRKTETGIIISNWRLEQI